MNSVSKWMPNPWLLLKEFTKPFIYIVGGFAALTAFFHLMFGENPVGPVLWFLSGSVEALVPLAVKLSYIWIFYTACYLLVGVYLRDLWDVSETPDLIREISEHRGYSSGFREFYDWAFRWPPVMPQALFKSRPPRHLTTCWTPGISPRVVYD